MSEEPTDNESTMYVRECVMTYRATATKLPDVRLTDASTVAVIARDLIPDGPQERVLAFLLDVKNKLVGVHTTAVGSIANCEVDTSMILRAALVAGASAIILVHNHPSDDCEPSESDVLLTQRVKRAATFVGLRLLDHVIIARREHYSFVEKGLL